MRAQTPQEAERRLRAASDLRRIAVEGKLDLRRRWRAGLVPFCVPISERSDPEAWEDPGGNPARRTPYPPVAVSARLMKS